MEVVIMQEELTEAGAVLDRLADIAGASTDAELAEYLLIARGTVSSWRCRDQIPFQHCMEAAKRSNVSLEWLINGRGPREISQLEERPAPPATVDPYADYLLRNYELVGKGGVRIAPDQSGMLPFPENSFPVAFKSKYIANLCGEIPGPAYGYLCRDDAMEPTIKKDWCVLVAAAQNEISEPGIYAVVMLETGDQTFRRITPLGREIHLHCDNPAYPRVTLDISAAPCPIAIIGRAVWSGGYLI